MPRSAPFSIRLLTARDVALMEAMSTMFGEAFDEADTYGGARPGAAYLEQLLGSGAREDVLHFDIPVRTRPGP